MITETETLLAEIENYCRDNGIAETTCGLQAVNDGKLCHRLRNGKSVTLATAEKIRTFLASTNAVLDPDEGADGVPVCEGVGPVARA